MSVRGLRVVALVLLWLGGACGQASDTDRSVSGPDGSPTSGSDGPPSRAADGPRPPAVADLALGVPRFVSADYIDLADIAKVSMFRGTGWGHDYSDGVETCRTMKHYYFPRLPQAEWGTVRILAPVDGTLVRLQDERTGGTQVHLSSDAQPAFTFVLFHVALAAGFAQGDRVRAGQPLGTHVGGQTTSDIAVWVATRDGRRLVSYFDTMADGLFASYQARGATNRSDFVITAEARDAENGAGEVSCDPAGYYSRPGGLPAWFMLRGP